MTRNNNKYNNHTPVTSSPYRRALSYVKGSAARTWRCATHPAARAPHLTAPRTSHVLRDGADGSAPLRAHCERPRASWGVCGVAPRRARCCDNTSPVAQRGAFSAWFSATP